MLVFLGPSGLYPLSLLHSRFRRIPVVVPIMWGEGEILAGISKFEY